MKPVFNFSSFAIDINLIQKRENKSNIPAMLIFLILLAMAGSIGFGWLWYNANDKLSIAQSELTTITTKMTTIETSLKQNKFSGQLSDVFNQPTLLKQQRPVTTQLLSQLNLLLPLYANVTQLDLNDQGTLNLTLYSSTMEDIITFSQSVQGSEQFKLIKMGTINKVENQTSTEKLEQPATVRNTITLPVYQTTFELKYVNDGKRS